MRKSLLLPPPSAIKKSRQYPQHNTWLARDEETERGSERVANVYGWVGGEGGHEELRTFQEGQEGLADLDVDVDDAGLYTVRESPGNCGPLWCRPRRTEIRAARQSRG
jgi:hypothetical protein